MLKIVIPLIVYLIVCIVTVFLPAFDGYDTLGWKLFIGQIYAIPILIISVFISFFLNKRVSDK